MTLYQYHSLAVYRKNVHDMKSHNIQEITFSCHTKSTKKVSILFLWKIFFGKRRACKRQLLDVYRNKNRKENKATSKRLITEA